MRNRTIPDQARLLAAVSELDASPAPATEVAARRLATAASALVPGDFSMVCLGEGGNGIADVQQWVEGRQLQADLPLWSSSVRGREHPVIALHDSTGLLITGRRSDVGSPRSLRPPIHYGYFWRPFGIENMVGAPVGFPNDRSYLASYREAGIHLSTTMGTRGSSAVIG